MMLAGPVKTSDGPGPGRPKVSIEAKQSGDEEERTWRAR